MNFARQTNHEVVEQVIQIHFHFQCHSLSIILLILKGFVYCYLTPIGVRFTTISLFHTFHIWLFTFKSFGFEIMNLF